MSYIVALEDQVRSLTKPELAAVKERVAKSSTLAGKFENVEDIARLNKKEGSRLADIIDKVLKDRTRKPRKSRSPPRKIVPPPSPPGYPTS